MEIKEKNKRLLIVVGVLLLFGGASLAYFITKILTNGNGGSTNVTTAVIKGATLNVEGILEFEDLEILPGHKTVSGIKVTAIGNNELIPYNLIWNGINTLTTPLEFKIYKTSEEIEVNATCEVKTKVIGASKQLSEECNITNIDKLGTEIARGRINKNDTKVILAKDEFVTATSTGEEVYYYVILEYPNLNEPQNYDLEGSLDGEVTVEESNIKPDINIIAAYVKQDDGEYKQVEDIPQSGYAVNRNKSTCTNNAVPIINNKKILVTNLSKSGTECSLYFDKEISLKIVEKMNFTVNTKNPKFSQIATEDEGVYAVYDEMYGGTSYYWRGAVTNNYVKFGGFCWRIIRINGDGSMRLIYDGTTCHANGEVTTDSIAVSDVAYNTKYDKLGYAGWTYVEGKQRPEAGDTVIDSNAKTRTEEWYNTNLASYSSKIAEGKYCNDRRIGVGGDTTVLNSELQNFWYAGLSRTKINKPTLSCDNNDIYTLKVGAITADEAMLAGGKYEKNESYYLFNGQTYWTLTPEDWYANTVGVFFINSDGFVSADFVVHNRFNIRPVINLKSDILFSGNGSIDNPFIVEGA